MERRTSVIPYQRKRTNQRNAYLTTINTVRNTYTCCKVTTSTVHKYCYCCVRNISYSIPERQAFWQYPFTTSFGVIVSYLLRKKNDTRPARRMRTSVGFRFYRRNSRGYQWVAHGYPMGIPWVSHGYPMGIPWVSRCLSIGHPWV